jgi:hypothetical protein
MNNNDFIRIEKLKATIERHKALELYSFAKLMFKLEYENHKTALHELDTMKQHVDIITDTVEKILEVKS